MEKKLLMKNKKPKKPHAVMFGQVKLVEVYLE